jgi:hypothetical protein
VAARCACFMSNAASRRLLTSRTSASHSLSPTPLPSQVRSLVGRRSVSDRPESVSSSVQNRMARGMRMRGFDPKPPDGSRSHGCVLRRLPRGTKCPSGKRWPLPLALPDGRSPAVTPQSRSQRRERLPSTRGSRSSLELLGSPDPHVGQGETEIPRGATRAGSTCPCLGCLLLVGDRFGTLVRSRQTGTALRLD